MVMCTHNCDQGRNCTCCSADSSAEELDDVKELAILGVLFVLGFVVLFGSVVVLLGL